MTHSVAGYLHFGAWSAVDHLLNSVSDDLLRGTLLAERYLASGRICSGDEARQWLANYADLPDVNRIYDLAKTHSGHVPVPSPKELKALRGRGGVDGGELWLRGPSVGHLSHKKTKTANALTARFHRALSHGSTLTAKRLLSESELPKLLTHTDFDRLRGTLGFSYFLDGRNDFARE